MGFNDKLRYLYGILYSQTCLQRSPLGQRKNERLRQVTVNLRSVDPDCQ